MTLQDKLGELVQQLIQGTERGAIAWTETADENSFRAILRNGLVRVEKTDGRDMMAPEAESAYSLVVLDEANKELARYCPSQVEEMYLRELWQTAERSARRVDEKIDGLLQELQDRLQATK